MFRIEFTPEAIDDLKSLRKYDQRRVVSEIETQLAQQPHFETRRRKRLRPNELAEWELRLDIFRIFYDVHFESADDAASIMPLDELDGRVKVVAVGWKEGSKLLIHGQEFEL